jgi:broad specificity phosphatase PhoE
MEARAHPKRSFSRWREPRRRDRPLVRAFRKLLAQPERVVLVVTHEVPIRYALGATAGISSPERSAVAVPNATAYLFDEASLQMAADRLETKAEPQWAAA